MIDQRVIDEVMLRTDIADVIEVYTGDRFRNGRILCPFHTDKTPSLSVKNGRFRCWACGENGSVIDFARKMFNLSFPEAFQKIAKDFNVSLPVQISTIEKKKRDPMEQAMIDFSSVRKREIQENITAKEQEIEHFTQECFRRRKAGEDIEDIEILIENNLQDIYFLRQVINGG